VYSPPAISVAITQVAHAVPNYQTIDLKAVSVEAGAHQ
jgi:hypothetical protein